MIKQANPPETEDVGVIVARFQTPFLHDAHKELIEFVQSRHPRTLIMLGLAQIKATENNPLDLDTRREMILDEYPKVTIGYIEDHRCDTKWSSHLDRQIAAKCNNGKLTPRLYGGRDSFLPYYEGKYPTSELESDTKVSGSQLRKLAGMVVGKKTIDYRMGVIWATQQQFPTAYNTVDVVPYDPNNGRILLCRKPDEHQYRCIGGFIDPGEKKIHAARRELAEEAGRNLMCDDFRYIDDFVIDDHRYRIERDSILTNLFTCKYVGGTASANDDIEQVRWFDITDFTYEGALESAVVPEHVELLKACLPDIMKQSNEAQEHLSQD